MPITFSQLASNTATVQVPTSLGPVTVVYYPNHITDKVLADMQAPNADENVMLEQLIQSWDIMTDEDSTIMFPLGRMNELGLPFKVQIMQAIMESMRPNSKTA